MTNKKYSVVDCSKRNELGDGLYISSIKYIIVIQQITGNHTFKESFRIFFFLKILLFLFIPMRYKNKHCFLKIFP